MTTEAMADQQALRAENYREVTGISGAEIF